MTRPIQLDKTYGVLHTESFFSFLGFAKKIGSDEIQKIDVFLDDKLIDTIEANEFIQKIDDMYDVENRAFKYNLPTQYIGTKAIISFKNHDSGEELLNSPYNLIDKNHEDFNEAIFIHSLEGSFDNEKIQNINPKDSIGFLGTEDNLLNKDFIKLINIFLEKNLNTKFKVFYFNKEQKKLISEKFNKYLSKIDFIMPKDIYDIANNTSIYIHSSTANEKPKSFGYWKTWRVLNQTKVNMFLINIFEEIDDKDYSKSLKLVDNCKIEFEKSIVSKIFETDERYNELCFMNSLKQPINEEKIKNLYCPNSIGFLATKENLGDEEFVEYINQIINDFSEQNFIAFYFRKDELKDAKSKFPKRDRLVYINLYDIKDVFSNLEVYLSNYMRTYKNIYENSIVSMLRYKSNNIACLGLWLSHNQTIEEHEENNKQNYQKFFKNIEYLGFKELDIKKHGFSLFGIFFKELSKKYNVDLNFNLKETMKISQVYYTLKIGVNNHEFYKFHINFTKKFIQLD
ncbi:hypothetical protein [Aliarcobacter skirrowii]|uniref:hypothetical protein n=1 Tax=Aliarcobacter skirrowii TaxID=28200 RepID=UPI000830589B|nr:hypothetical protein [Aliarcobacter skirrowii]